jgi:hypothetical protein
MMKLQSGILMIGSLYWNMEPYRQEWRKNYLHMDQVAPIKVPIRYGRKSGTGSYTMVFAPECPMGKAKVVRCRNDVSSTDDIVLTARELWIAERPAGLKPTPGEAHSASWGCVALLVNPTTKVPQNILEEWAERVSAERSARTKASNYDVVPYSVKQKSAIDARGLLQIPWPNRADNDEPLASFDLLLATVTRPTPDSRTGDFANVAAIAEAWNEVGNATYFRSNRENDFHTFQDSEIEALLRV